jgi:glycyl-tRNA synthetase
MEGLYEVNGLLFWTEREIKQREHIEEHLRAAVMEALLSQNSAFQIVKVEAPLLTPAELINPNYTADDVYSLGQLVLRPETTMGSYAAAKKLLSGYNEVKYRAPLVVYQHGKSFRREQDQPTKFMRLKEFYQLEFQIIFSPKTANDYSLTLYPAVLKALGDVVGECRIEPSDRLPDYSEETTDIVCSKTGMEICSMSKRKDLEGYKVIEVAVGTDRCIYNFQNK